MITIDIHKPKSFPKAFQQISKLEPNQRKEALKTLHGFQYTALALAVTYMSSHEESPDFIAQLLDGLKPADVIEVFQVCQPKSGRQRGFDTILTFTLINCPRMMPILLEQLTLKIGEEAKDRLLHEKGGKLKSSAYELLQRIDVHTKNKHQASPLPEETMVQHPTDVTAVAAPPTNDQLPVLTPELLTPVQKDPIEKSLTLELSITPPADTNIISTQPRTLDVAVSPSPKPDLFETTVSPIPEHPLTPRPITEAQPSIESIPVIEQTVVEVVDATRQASPISSSPIVTEQQGAPRRLSRASSFNEDSSSKGQPIRIIEEIITTKTDELATLVQQLSGTLLYDKLFALHQSLQKHQQTYQNASNDSDSDDKILELCQNYLNTLNAAKPLLVQHRDLTYWAKGFLDILSSPIRALISVSRFLQNPAEGFQFRLFIYKPKRANDTLVKNTEDLLKALENVVQDPEAMVSETTHDKTRTEQEIIDNFNTQITTQVAMKDAIRVYCQTDHGDNEPHNSPGVY